MMPAVKHIDPVIGIDVHLIQPPPPAPPLPMPHPFIGLIFDPFDYIPMLGATVSVNGLPAAIAGTMAMPVPHFPIGGVFMGLPPGNEGEMFMGSSTVSFDGDAASYGVLPVLSCQSIGMLPPFRPRSKKPKLGSLMLPTSIVLPIPLGAPVLVGGSPTISLMALGAYGAMRGLSGLGKGLKKLRKLQKSSDRFRRLSQRMRRAADDVMDRLNVSKASRMRNRVKRAICTVTGHPVDVATGKVFTEAVDLALPGPLPFRLERVWQSTSTYEGPLGHGWHHSYDLALWQDQEEGVVIVRLGDGRHLAFAVPTEETPSYHRQERLWLRRTAEGYRLEEDGGGLRYVFADPRTGGDGAPAPSLPEWPLARVEDANGNAIRFVRDGRTGHLLKIIDGAGRRLGVTTDAAGRITQLTGPHPEDAERRIVLLRYHYDHRGHLQRVDDAHGRPLRYAYDSRLLVKETDRSGLSFHFRYDGDDEQARCVETWGDGGIYARTLRYDLAAQTTTVSDTRGAETTYHWNALGLVTKTVSPDGAVHETAYDEDGNKLTETDPLGHVTTYEYDDAGRLVAVTDPEGGTRRTAFDAEGRATRLEDELGHTWLRTYDARGNVAAATDPEGHTTRYDTERRGLPVEITDANGETLTLHWDGVGNLEHIADRTGAETRLAHDRLGHLVRRIDAEGAVTELHRDVLGQITKVVTAAQTPEERHSRFAYDPAGNLIRATDPLGRSRKFDYGPHGPGGVLDRILEPSGAETRYRYDREGDLAGVHDATGRTWHFERDKAGRVVEERDFTGRRLTYGYDAAGQLREMTNGRGQTTQMERDITGRLTRRTYADGQEETFAYDAGGRLTEAVNGAAAVEWEYDALGRVTTEIQNGYAVKHRYDAVGNRVGRAGPEGRELSFAYDAEGRLAEVANPFGRLMAFTRDGLGRETRRTLPSGVVAEREYSRTGELLSQRTARSGDRSPLLDRRYHYNAAGQLEQVSDARFGTTTFRHNVDGFLERVAYPEGTLERYLYDAAGNVPAAPVRLDALEGSTSGDGQAGLPPELHTGGVARRVAATRVAEGWTLSYDADGNLIRKRNDETEYRFHYDAAGRMSRAECDGQEVARFVYDALGRRVEKDTPEQTVTYYWDGDQLLFEQVEQKETEKVSGREYVFAGFEPLAAFSDDGEDWLFETDQVGTPRLVVDREGELVWEADFTGFGEVREEQGEAEMELRYPGQIYDEETRLSYNRFRYYDAELRCYTQSDLLGLGGGLSPHNYVPDPTAWSDPYGLDCKKRINVGASGHHVPAVRKSRGRPFEVERSDKTRPTLHFRGNDPGQDHWRLHDAERSHIGPRQGDFGGTDDELFDAYREAYEGLDDIRVDVRSPNGTYNLGEDVSPREAVDLIDNWLKQQNLR